MVGVFSIMVAFKDKHCVVTLQGVSALDSSLPAAVRKYFWVQAAQSQTTPPAPNVRGRVMVSETALPALNVRERELMDYGLCQLLLKCISGFRYGTAEDKFIIANSDAVTICKNISVLICQLLAVYQDSIGTALVGDDILIINIFE